MNKTCLYVPVNINQFYIKTMEFANSENDDYDFVKSEGEYKPDGSCGEPVDIYYYKLW